MCNLARMVAIMFQRDILCLIQEQDSIDITDSKMKIYQKFTEVISDIILMFLILAPLLSVSAIGALWMYYLGYKIFSLELWK